MDGFRSGWNTTPKSLPREPYSTLRLFPGKRSETGFPIFRSGFSARYGMRQEDSKEIDWPT